MQKITLYHNPRCTKSRQTLQLLRENDIEPKIIEYMEEPLSKTELKRLIKLLGISPRELMRKTEADYKSNQLSDTDLSDDALIEAMLEFPKIMQRPIVVKGNKAVLGRPPENIMEII